MTVDTIDIILQKTKEYLIKYNKKKFTFIFHGGEPLLMKKQFFKTFIAKSNRLERELRNVAFHYSIQTNGVLLDKSWCELLGKLDINIGISIDGTKKAHDMYRLDHKGKGSYDRVGKGAKIVKRTLDYLDIACVINVNDAPEKVYTSFKKMKASMVNYIIPDYTHDNYPYAANENETPMADWLIRLFDIWINDPNRYKILMFNGLINGLIGISKSDDNESRVLVVETNGEIEAIDSLKACGHGFTKSNMNVKTHTFSDILYSPLGKLYFEDSTTKLPGKCLQCPVMNICRGGRLVHRFKKDNGFNNPSVYCEDMIKLISHIQHKMIQLFPNLYEGRAIEKMDYIEINNFLNNNSIKKVMPVYSKELENFGM